MAFIAQCLLLRQVINKMMIWFLLPNKTLPESDNDAIVTISSYCLRGAGTKTHYEYEVRICTNDDRWSILRRYSRFRDLHIAMKARYGEKVSTIPFPSKQLFANSETVAKSRKRQLEFYLRRLIDTCKNLPSCPLAYGGPVTKVALISFSPFFRKGVFENGKYGTSWLLPYDRPYWILATFPLSDSLSPIY